MYKGTVGSCPRVLHVSFNCVLHVLRITPEVEWEARLRMLVRNLRTKKVEYWVKVSESYGASLLGSSGIKAVKRFSLTTLTLFRC